MEGLMLKLKLQYFGYLMRRADSFVKTLMLGKIEGRRRRGQQRMRWLDGITDSMEFEQAPGVGDGQGSLACCSPWGLKVQFSSVTESCPTLCNPMDWSTPGLPVLHQLLELAQTPVHQVGDAIQPSHPLSSPSVSSTSPLYTDKIFQVNSFLSRES